MNRPVFFTGAAILVAVGICYRLLPSGENSVAPKSSDQKEVFGSLLPIPSAAASTPQAKAGTQVSQLQKTTADRRRVYDSPDIMATINDIRHHGTPDERDWSALLLSSCTVRFMHPLAPLPLEGAEQPVPVSKPVSKELEARKKRAADELSERCKGVKGLSVEDRARLKRELLEPAANYHSTLRRLGDMSREDGRWSTEEAQLITDSLYSGDPVVVRQAFLTMLAAIDWNAPGGKDRQDAFMLSLGAFHGKGPMSEYERLEGCANMGWCGSDWGSDEGYPAPNAAVLQLASKYDAAVKARMDARGVLSIR